MTRQNKTTPAGWVFIMLAIAVWLMLTFWEIGEVGK